jgi:hypothetical protein
VKTAQPPYRERIRQMPWLARCRLDQFPKLLGGPASIPVGGTKWQSLT